MLAVLLIVIDDLPHECIWRQWAQGNVDFYIHAKFPACIKSDWVKQRLIDISYKPKWGSVEITSAMLALLTTAEKNNIIQKFVFASESCVPIASLATTLRVLTPDVSWVNYHTAPTNKYDVIQKWERIPTEVARDNIAKADQWLCLTRTHAVEIIQQHRQTNGHLLRMMTHVVASDEMYFATALRTLGFLETEAVLCRRVTFCDWSYSSKHPRPYEDLDYSAIETAQAEGCLFMRKFGKDIVPRSWAKILI